MPLPLLISEGLCAHPVGWKIPVQPPPDVAHEGVRPNTKSGRAPEEVIVVIIASFAVEYVKTPALVLIFGQTYVVSQSLTYPALKEADHRGLEKLSCVMPKNAWVTVKIGTEHVCAVKKLETSKLNTNSEADRSRRMFI